MTIDRVVRVLQGVSVPVQEVRNLADKLADIVIPDMYYQLRPGWVEYMRTSDGYNLLDHQTNYYDDLSEEERRLVIRVDEVSTLSLGGINVTVDRTAEELNFVFFDVNSRISFEPKYENSFSTSLKEMAPAAKMTLASIGLLFSREVLVHVLHEVD